MGISQSTSEEQKSVNTNHNFENIFKLYLLNDDMDEILVNNVKYKIDLKYFSKEYLGSDYFDNFVKYGQKSLTLDLQDENSFIKFILSVYGKKYKIKTYIQYLDLLYMEDYFQVRINIPNPQNFDYKGEDKNKHYLDYLRIRQKKIWKLDACHLIKLYPNYKKNITDNLPNKLAEFLWNANDYNKTRYYGYVKRKDEDIPSESIVLRYPTSLNVNNHGIKIISLFSDIFDYWTDMKNIKISMFGCVLYYTYNSIESGSEPDSPNLCKKYLVICFIGDLYSKYVIKYHPYWDNGKGDMRIDKKHDGEIYEMLENGVEHNFDGCNYYDSLITNFSNETLYETKDNFGNINSAYILNSAERCIIDKYSNYHLYDLNSDSDCEYFLHELISDKIYDENVEHIPEGMYLVYLGDELCVDISSKDLTIDHNPTFNKRFEEKFQNISYINKLKIPVNSGYKYDRKCTIYFSYILVKISLKINEIFKYVVKLDYLDRNNTEIH